MTASVVFLDLRRQVESIRGELDEAIGGVLDRGRFVLDETVEAFEAAFAAYCGAREAVGVASGRDAIAIALRALGVGAGDEVVVPANTCEPTVAGVEAAGAAPVFADVEARTFGLDAGSVERALSPRTKAVVVVHLYGQCADLEPVAAVARRAGLKIVEDAAHAHGAEYGGRRAGALGDAAAFSFYPTKNLGALGDAGAVVTDEPEVARRARLLRSYGGPERGTSSRLDALQAAALLVKLGRLDGWNERRRELAGRYLEALADASLELPAEAPGRRHVYHLFVVRSEARDRLRADLAAAGIETLVHYPQALAPLPTAQALCSSVLSLPLYPELTAVEQERVIAAVRETASLRGAARARPRPAPRAS
jgi:dTDP-4-amino-4,6-dideoxygalactose transaminase